MIEFKVLKKSKKSRARLGILKTPHGEIETPTLVPVATQATVKAMTLAEIKEIGYNLLICNTFHLHLKPGDKIVKSGGKLHKYMNWQGGIMTDSGGFQVFSLGFGTDHGVGKKMKNFINEDLNSLIEVNNQPRNIKITDEGVFFRSPLSGDKMFLGPKESIKIQQNLGADIIYAFDECTSPLATREYVEKSLDKTHAWAKACLKFRKTDQALFGIVQGSYFQDLRGKSAKYINSLGFDGFGIGGDLGISLQDTANILDWSVPYLDEAKPKHLLGMGYLEDMEVIIKGGCDSFDCTVPTQFARRGYVFTSEGKICLKQSRYLNDQNPIDKNCSCEVCQTYKRSYLCHLYRAHEITPLRLLSYHNLYHFNQAVKKLREKIKKDEI